MTFYTFANATSAIPLANLDANFATPITLGNTAVAINNTYSAIGNMTLNNVTIASGNSTVTIPAARLGSSAGILSYAWGWTSIPTALASAYGWTFTEIGRAHV